MIVIQDVLISEDIIEAQFHCNLAACKGACCWEGDYGAPVEDAEMEVIQHNLAAIQNNLSEASQKLISETGPFTYYKKAKVTGTTCHPDGACVFLIREPGGIAQCGIEKSYIDGKIDYRKPLSCHLYPIRVSRNEIVGFEAWNYDQWDICSAACVLGKEKRMPVYKFVKDAIIRYKGQDFYDELDAAAIHLGEQKTI